MPADHNALVKYAYTRDHSSIYFRKEDGDFDKVSCHENNSSSDFAAVKASTSPNFVKVVIVVSVVVVGLAVVAGAIAVAVVFSTKDDGDRSNTDRQTSETTSPSFSGVSTAISTSGLSTSKTTSSVTGLQTTTTVSTSVSGGSTASTGPPTTATTSSNVTGGSTSQTSTSPSSSSSWGEWTECTVTCGQGFHTRYRSCNSTVSDCDYVQTDVCEETICPVMGRWVTWSQWGSCNTTCGGGIQTRTRSCSKINSSDLDCVGENFQKRVCNDWKCPDCLQKCNVGTLNGDCTACICNDRTVTGRIRSSATGNSISNAAVYDSAAPTSILGLSNVTGYFVLTTKCIQSEILITKEGFVDQTIVINGSYIEIEMEKTVPPFLVQSPQSKVRLTGEDVTLCCEAEGNPSITYYEWFKDSVLIDKMEDVNRSQILLTNLSTEGSGYYQCRANSDVGAVISTPVNLVIRENPDEFCKDALRQKKLVLPDDCVQHETNTSLYEVGECMAKSCRINSTEGNKQCSDDENSCCSAAETTIETVNCKDYSLDIIVVKSCGCGQCYQEELIFFGTVTGTDTGSPVRFCKVLVNGKLQTYTNLRGQYKFSISKPSSRITITVIDESLQYLPTTKVISTENTVGGLLRVDMKLVKAAQPIIVDSSLENVLSAGTAINSSSPKIELKLPANSFYYPNGSAYSGLVKALFTYLDPTNVSDFANIPGVFQYTNEDGELGNLDTLGVFNLYVEDLNGIRLEITNAVKAYIPYDIGNNETYENFKLWTLNPQSGIWEDTTTPQVIKRQIRSKRDTAKLEIGQIVGVSNFEWHNYDRVSIISPNVCYFKICLFKDASLTVKENSLTNVYLNIYVKKGNILYTIWVYFHDPNTFITKTFCDGDEALIVPENHGRQIYVADPSPNTVNFKLASDAKSLSTKLSLSPEILFHPTSSFGGQSCLNLYYAQTDLEWRYKDTRITVVTNGVCTDSYRYFFWYPLYAFDNQYAVCFVKVRVNLTVGVNFNSYEKVKIRVMSSFDSKIIGISERNINLNTNRDITECIEYRCSGYIDPCDDNTVYNTRVKVIIEHSRSDVVFSVVNQSQNLLTSVTKPDKFEFTAPNTYGSLDGIYSLRGKVISDVNNLANKFCLAADLSTTITRPLNGLAVTFQGSMG